jgi:hypothetical protein
MVAAAVIGGAVVGGVATTMAGNKAAGAQQDAANTAAGVQYAALDQMQQNQSPYMQAGQDALSQYQQMLASGQLSPQFSFNPTMAQLEQTPGYQFALQQGLKGVQNSAAAKGLGYSGAQIKGAEQFGTGLASQTYQQQYQNALQNFNTNYQVGQNAANRLSGLVSLGQNAAAGVGNAGIQVAGNVGNALIGAGNAQAAAYTNMGNAVNGAIGNGIQGYYLNQALGGGAQNSLYGGQQSAQSYPVDMSSPQGVPYG